MDWQAMSALSSLISAVAVVAGTFFVVVQLREAARDRSVSINSHLFEIWQRPEFQEDQLYLLHHLEADSWEELIARGRGHRAERALHRVGGYYDYVGLQIARGLIKDEEILATLGGHAIAVWERIEGLVHGARRAENSVLFQNFEALLPECRQCYVPSAAPTRSEVLETISASELAGLLEQEAALVLDVSRNANAHRVRGAVRTDPNDLRGWLEAARAADKTVVTYCNCPRDASSRKAAELLRQAGVDRVKVLRGGIKAWQDRRLPLSMA